MCHIHEGVEVKVWRGEGVEVRVGGEVWRGEGVEVTCNMYLTDKPSHSRPILYSASHKPLRDHTVGHGYDTRRVPGGERRLTLALVLLTHIALPFPLPPPPLPSTPSPSFLTCVIWRRGVQ